MKLHYSILKDDRTILNIFIIIVCLFLANLASGQTTYVPDDNFEQALIDLGYDTAPLDDYVPTANISGVTRLNVIGKNISDMTGIEGFTSLTSLSALSNNFTSLDLTSNTNLRSVFAGFCNLLTIDVSNCPSLEILNITNNNLLALDVSNNPLLEDLTVGSNNLLNLDVSNNPLISTLDCSSNNLTSLDVTSLSNLEILFCSSNNLTSLDVTNNPLLKTLLAGINPMSSIDLSMNPLLTFLSLIGNQLTSIDLSNNNLIETLNLRSNSISFIDVSNLAFLDDFDIGRNDLTTIDVSANLLLNEIDITSNLLTDVDLSSNSLLNRVNVGFNNLTSFNIQNGTNPIINYFYARFNNLTCIQVDNEAYSTANWTNIDAGTVFSTDCSLLLPVELVDFNAYHKGTFVQLEWQTASEENNDFFEIQKSQDGVAFESIGKVIGEGTTFELNSYTFPDQDPFRGINYYRLKQVDYDGQYEYSKVVSVNIEEDNELTLFPNPTDGAITIGGITDENPSIQITDQMGRTLMASNRPQFNISHLPKGTYNVSVIEGRNIKVFRVNRL